MPIPMPFRFEKLTIKAQEAVRRARKSWPPRRGNPQIEPMHLLAALLAEEEGIVGRCSDKIGANRAATGADRRCRARSICQGRAAASQLAVAVEQTCSSASKRPSAKPTAMKDEFVSTEHLLLALARSNRKAKNVLKLNAITEKELLEPCNRSAASARVTDQSPEGKFQALEKYGIDLVERARQGKLDPVIGRDQEIRRVIQVLSRRTKNNPVLIGEPGVGKTAIAEGLALRIVQGDVPREPQEQTRRSPSIWAR